MKKPSPEPTAIGKDQSYALIAKKVIGYYTGLPWAPSLVLLALLVLWPIGAFWSRIHFDAATFVEEWIKLSLGSFLLLFVIEIARHRAERHISLDQAFEFAKTNVEMPLLGVVTCIEQALQAAREGKWAELQAALEQAWQTWSRLDANLKALALMSMDPVLKALLLSLRESQDLLRCEGVLRSYKGTLRGADVNQADLADALQKARKLLNVLQEAGIH